MAILSYFKGMEIFCEFLFKSSLILVFTLCFYFLLKKKSAAFRHFLLSLSLMFLLVLPFLTAFAPGWQAGIFPSFGTNSTENNLSRDNGIRLTHGKPGEAKLIPGTLLLPEKVNESSPLFLSLRNLCPYAAVIFWSLGLILLFLKLGFGLYGTLKFTSRGIAITGRPWKELLLLFLKKTPVKGKIRLLKNERVIIPMTWGVRKPVVMLPAESVNWTIEQCSTVLFHELSHIKRRDFLVRLVAKVSCALYWFNPLCWIVFRQLKIEQEKACDEMVLKAGIKPSIYASCLLHMKKTIEKARGHYVPAAAIGMAGKSEFNERLTTILKKQLIPKEEKMKTRITLLVLGLFAAALIGTAKPGPTPLPMDHEEAALSQPSRSGQNPTAATDEKEKKEKAKEKEKQEKKKQVWVSVKEESDETKGKEGEKKFNIYISEDECDEKGNVKRKAKKVVCLPADADIAKIKIEGDCLLIYENDKPVKKIKLESKEGKKIGKDVYVTGEGDKKIVWIGKEGDKKFNIYMDGGKGGDKDIHIMMKKGKLSTCGEKGIWVIKEDEGEEGTRVLKIRKSGDKDDEEHVYKIKTKILEDSELKKSMEDLKKSMENIDKSFKTKSADQEKALKEMEKALQKMEQELEKRDEKHKNVQVILEGDDDELIEIDEAHEKHIAVKKMKGDNFLFIGDDASFHMEINTDEKIGQKQQDQVKKAAAKLKKNLPESYEVKSDISAKRQKITIKSGEEKAGKKDYDAIMKEIKKFEEELEKILPGLEGKKSLRKNIRIKKKEEKKK